MWLQKKVEFVQGNVRHQLARSFVNVTTLSDSNRWTEMQSTYEGLFDHWDGHLACLVEFWSHPSVVKGGFQHCLRDHMSSNHLCLWAALYEGKPGSLYWCTPLLVHTCKRSIEGKRSGRGSILHGFKLAHQSFGHDYGEMKKRWRSPKSIVYQRLDQVSLGCCRQLAITAAYLWCSHTMVSEQR